MPGPLDIAGRGYARVHLYLTGAGAVLGGLADMAAADYRLSGSAAPAAGEAAGKPFVAAFKRRTQQRYIDKAAESGLFALHRAAEAMQLDQARLDRAPERVGLLLATGLGPAGTREQYLGSYGQRGGKSVSATLFSNCGYNIVGSILARSRGIRGPVLTFGAGPDWPGHLLLTARRLLAAGRVELVFAGRAEAEAAVILALEAAPAGGGRPALPLEVSAEQGVPADDLPWKLAARWFGQAGPAGAVAARPGGAAR